MRLWSQLEIEVVPSQLIPKSESQNSDYSRSQFSPVCELSRWNLHLYVIIEMSQALIKRRCHLQKTLTLDLTKYSWHGATCPKVFKRDREGGVLCKLRRLLRSMTALAPSKGDTTQWTRAGRLEGLSLIHFGFQSSFYLRSCLDANDCTEYTDSKRN